MDVRKVLENHIDLREKLFIRGFVVTNNNEINPEGYPFYGNWNNTKIAELNFWTHKLTGFHFAQKDNITAFILGHCYNPFTMEAAEEKCLDEILSYYDTVDFWDKVNELTGIFVLGFINGNAIQFIVDPAGMQSACYGYVGKDFYLSSHPQLVGDLCTLEMTNLCKEIISYKWYPRICGCYLPADMEPYEELKRVVPNISYSTDIDKKNLNHFRFYPVQNLEECKDDKEYNEVIEKAADILKNNMTLVLEKWSNAWQSLTGGIDSNTTFAAANGHYEKYHTFSYLSAPKEVPDSEAAQKISKHFNVEWNLYKIPENNEEIERFEEKKAILQHNSNEIAFRKDNEYRKRITLEEQCAADVEIKSWVSETIRAYWYKYYGRKSFPKLSPKLFRNLYKIFILNRKLAHKIDKLFATYIEDFEYGKIPKQYPIADIHYNEVTWGSWGGMNISEMKYCFDITIIYNNRKFLDLLFKVPLDKRISDQHHRDMKKLLNQELYDMNIYVKNLEETKKRSSRLNMIFTMNRFLP